jgi:hypothetical protein
MKGHAQNRSLGKRRRLTLMAVPVLRSVRNGGQTPRPHGRRRTAAVRDSRPLSGPRSCLNLIDRCPMDLARLRR